MPRLGVLGTLVWDRLLDRAPGEGPREEWGGIAYALGGLDAALPDGWQVVPLVKVGRDRAAAAHRVLQGLTRLAPAARFIETAAMTPVVSIRYRPDGRTCEGVAGGVPPWTWAELGPLVHDLDALYLNFITGHEMPLETARALRVGFRGPIYADLHNLVPGADAAAWFGCFDTVQMNDDEAARLGSDPLAAAASALAAGASRFVVTLGARGAAYVARSGTTTVSERVPAPTVEAIDTMGCGDVFGATLAARLLAGTPIGPAVAAANAEAARTATLRGAADLAAHLRGTLLLPAGP